MGDVVYQCLRCGGTVRLSEFAVPDARRCAACGAEAVAPSSDSADTSRRVRLADANTVQRLDGRPPEPRATAPMVSHPGRQAARSALRKRRPPATWLGPLALAVYAVPMGLLLRAAIRDDTWVRHYLIARYVALAAPWLLVTVEALREGLFYGMGCLFIPGYIVVYSLRRVERAWMRYLILGALALLAAEYFWWHDRSVVAWLAGEAQAFNSRVRLLLKRAGDPEYLK